MIFATVNSKSQKLHLTFCSYGITENMRSLRSRSRFKIHNDLYIDTVVQSPINNSKYQYYRFGRSLHQISFVLRQSTNEKHTVRCLLHFIYNLVGPSLVFHYSPQRIIRIVTSGPPDLDPFGFPEYTSNPLFHHVLNVIHYHL